MGAEITPMPSHSVVRKSDSFRFLLCRFCVAEPIAERTAFQDLHEGGIRSPRVPLGIASEEGEMNVAGFKGSLQPPQRKRGSAQTLTDQRESIRWNVTRLGCSLERT